MHTHAAPHLSGNRGFTLIELTIVLLLTGILASTAIPRVMDASGQAKIGTLEAMGGAIFSASQMARTKARLEGVGHGIKVDIDYNGDGTKELETTFGYPSESRTKGIPKIIGGNFQTQWTWSSNGGRSLFYLTTAAISGRKGNYINNTAVIRENCYLTYAIASSSSAPVINYVTSGC
jgi:MSHA pilin protein MshA